MDKAFADEPTTYAPKIRLFVQADLTAGACIVPSTGQAHYLLHVMRCRVGERVALFNGRDGEWQARIASADRRACTLEVETLERMQSAAADLWLLFAPVKRARIDFIVEKATELGVSVLQPVLTRRTVVDRVPLARLGAAAIEAAEQSRRLDVPEIRPARPLDALLSDWPSGRRLLFCDETGGGAPIAQALTEQPIGAWAALIGPEGGFAVEEHRALGACAQAVPVSLGPRILRSDTAVVAALAVLQALRGDWS
jgi:16S rRNA (uracil1498-N3)-methyltransferase